MTSSALVDLSNRLSPVHRPTTEERATIRANIVHRFVAEDAELLIEALGVAR